MQGGKENKKKSKKNEEKNKKIDIKLINYCYILLQIHFIHYPFFVELLDNLKIHKFLINFNDI